MRAEREVIKIGTMFIVLFPGWS